MNSTWAFILCCTTLCLCWIPYLIDSLKDVQHKCSNCQTVVANVKSNGSVEVVAPVMVESQYAQPSQTTKA